MKLVPTIDELKHLMDINASVYGAFHKEAKEEFASQYERAVLPKLKSDFASLINEGRKRGIVWNELEIIGYEHVSSGNSTTSIVITLESGKKVHRLLVEDALIIKGHWHVGRSIRLL